MIKTINVIFDPNREDMDEFKTHLAERKGQVDTLLDTINNRTHSHLVDNLTQQMAVVTLEELQSVIGKIDKMLKSLPASKEALPATIAYFNNRLPNVLAWLDSSRRIRGMEEVTLDGLGFDVIETITDVTENYDFFIAEIRDQEKSNYDSILSLTSIVKNKGHEDETTLDIKMELIEALERLTDISEVIRNTLDESFSVRTITFMVGAYNDKMGEVFHLLLDNPRLWRD